MKDPDVKDTTEAMDAVSMYEWALGDNVGIHTDWNIIENVTTVDNKHQLEHCIQCFKCFVTRTQN
jgi:hypothetical protein